MVINKTPQKKVVEKTEEERKEELIDQLRGYSLSVLTLAAMYANDYQHTGRDITKDLEDAQEREAVFHMIYKEGYKDGYIYGLAEGKELERTETKMMQKRVQLDDGFIDVADKPKLVLQRPRKKSYTKKRHKR